jgi:N-acetylmuramoyl-L-alanine amidase
MIGGVNMGEMDDMLASVLLDLSQTGAIGASRTVGNHMLDELGRIGRARTREVQGANFLVLKAPDVPSILVETGFISNPQEEARLRDAAHQAAVAQGMLNGIRAYFADHAPPATLVAANGIGASPQGLAREHVIARGETLSGLARRYNVSVQAIRASNNLANDRIRVGQTLLIPPG